MAWYNNGYMYKKLIAIQPSQVSGGANLSNFPQLVSMTDADLKTVANGGYVQNSSGYDIIFTEGAEIVKLDHEIESYNASTGAIVMWMRIPTLAYSTNTNIYMYFGNSSIATSQENKTGVWDSNHKRVYHLANGTTLSTADSTGNAQDGTNNGATATTGQIDGGASIDSGGSQYITLPTTGLPSGASAFSFSCFVKLPASPGSNTYYPFFAVGTTSGNQLIGVYYHASHGAQGSQLFSMIDWNDNGVYTSNGFVQFATWYLLHATYDGTTFRFYVNGALIGTFSEALNIAYGIAYIGSDGPNQGRGIVDEVRISNVARSAGWIATEYNNQSNPGAYVVAGARITQPAFAANYFFGSFQINANSGGRGLFFPGKALDMPVVTPATFPIARYDGVKKSGESVGPRDLDIELKVVASSRTDLMSRLDALQQALVLRSQSLCIHEDGRIFQSADCLSAKAFVKQVASCLVQCQFRVYTPYAYDAVSSSYDTGITVLTLASSLWTFPTISIIGGGTYHSYPLFHIINKTSTGSTTLSAGLTSGNSYTSISVNATSFSASVGDDITITHSGTTQTLNVTAAFSVGATSISVTSFVASVTYSSGDAVAKVTQWTAITISQTQDSQTISANSTSATPLPSANNDYIDVQCDPATGMSIQTNGSGKFSDPNGVFVTMQPGVTTFNISIACASAVSAQCIISWVPRYIS